MSNITLNDNKAFRNALITKVELKNGKITEVITIFNNSEIGFEEINIGVKKALEYSHRAKTMQSALHSIKDGKLNQHCIFEKSEIKEYNPELDPELNGYL